MNDILEKYPAPWKIVKVKRMDYYRVENADNQYIMWGNDIKVLEFVVSLANKGYHHIPIEIIEI